MELKIFHRQNPASATHVQQPLTTSKQGSCRRYSSPSKKQKPLLSCHRAGSCLSLSSYTGTTCCDIALDHTIHSMGLRGQLC